MRSVNLEQVDRLIQWLVDNPDDSDKVTLNRRVLIDVLSFLMEQINEPGRSTRYGWNAHGGGEVFFRGDDLFFEIKISSDDMKQSGGGITYYRNRIQDSMRGLLGGFFSSIRDADWKIVESTDAATRSFVWSLKVPLREQYEANPHVEEAVGEAVIKMDKKQSNVLKQFLAQCQRGR